MSKKLNLSGKLDFTDIDLTAPEVVINELLEELPPMPDQDFQRTTKL